MNANGQFTHTINWTSKQEPIPIHKYLKDECIGKGFSLIPIHVDGKYVLPLQRVYV